MDTSLVGSKKDRIKWINNGFNLYIHDISSSKIYVLDNPKYDEIIRVLIETHELIYQYIIGEVNLNRGRKLYKLIENNKITKEELKEILIVLNECLIKSKSIELYNLVKDEINIIIDKIVNNNLDDSLSIKDRFIKLNRNNTFDYKLLENKDIKSRLEYIFNNIDILYYYILSEFKLIEQIKILLIIYNKIDSNIKYITFENIMKSMYIDYNNKKTINIYKKRIIEKCLEDISIESIINNNYKNNFHIDYEIINKNDTLVFNFKFSIQAIKLIEFCEVAYTTNSIYNKAVYMLYDLFGFRSDVYDRFYNEVNYLARMNSSISNKKVLLDYIVGNNILDVGPGGGVLLDLIEEDNANYKVYGMDISNNVIEELNKKKKKEKRNWNIIKGDALYLENYFKVNEIDTIIYSSILHEIYSYTNYNNQLFNIDSVIKALSSAYNIIPIGGRIIIRDGIKTEPVNMYRIIEFKNKEDINILDNYCKDFKGRKITYEKIDENKYKMLVNDAMEFLYTYTWGENSYSLEVKEQFGYLTPSEYIDLIKNNLPNSKIIECNAFLQVGYEKNLLNKITLYDEEMNITRLPNSTIIMVIEKR